MASPTFWVALICQLIIVIGYFWFYRKEQLGMSTSLLATFLVLTCASSTSMMSEYFLHLADIEFNFGGMVFWIVVTGHCIWAFADHILFHTTSYRIYGPHSSLRSSHASKSWTYIYLLVITIHFLK
jgi:hypothetical protein